MAKIINHIRLGHRLHVTQGGMASHDDGNFFFFLPDDPVSGVATPFRHRGVGQQMADGTFHFVSTPCPRTRSILLHKTAHGRLSATARGDIRLTLIFQKLEAIDIAKAIVAEAAEAARTL